MADKPTHDYFLLMCGDCDEARRQTQCPPVPDWFWVPPCPDPNRQDDCPSHARRAWRTISERSIF